MNQLNEFIKSFDLIIFDLDGTLIDSHNQIEKAMNQARIELGYGKSPSGQIFHKLGQPVYDLFIDLQISPTLQEQLVSLFRMYLTREIEVTNECFPNVIELISLIRSHGINTAIATSKQTLMAQKVVSCSLLNGNIDHVQGTDGFTPKPNPKVINLCLDRFPECQAIMIGDRTEDIIAAKNAGIPSIGIAQSAHSISDLQLAGATFSFENISDFYNWAKT
jgi:phosphoglycolate phosphatase-like HAD superfamily hydrolase